MINTQVENLNTKYLQLATMPSILEEDFTNALPAILQSTAEILEVESVSLWRYSSDGGILYCQNVFDRVEKTQPDMSIHVLDHMVYFEALKTNRVLPVDDVYKDGRTSELADDYWKKLGTVSIIDVPILVLGCGKGVLRCEHRGTKRTWTDPELMFATQVADLIAQTILRVEKSKSERFLENMQSNFDQVLTETIKTKDLVSTLKNVLEDLNNVLKMPMGLVYLDGKMVTQGLSENWGMQVKRLVQDNMEYFLETLYVEDWQTRTGPIKEFCSLMEGQDIRTSIITPILMEDTLPGFMMLCGTNAHQWSEDEKNFVEVVGTFLCTLAEMIHFSSLTELQNNTLDRLDILGEKLNTIVSVEDAVERIGDSTLEIMNPDHVVICLKGHEGDIICPWSYEFSNSDLESHDIRQVDKLLDLVFFSSDPITISNITSAGVDRRLRGFADKEGFTTLGFWPVIYLNEVIGTIACFYNTVHQFSRTELKAMQMLSKQAVTSLLTTRLYNQIEQNYINVVLALADELEIRDLVEKTSGESVAKWAQEVALNMDCSEEEIQEIYWAVRLHDIGKTVIPQKLLRKDGSLTEEEWKIVRKHPLLGEKYVLPISRFRTVSTIIRSFREHLNGNGYPDGLHGEQIPMGARILAVADAYGSMISDRPYREKLTHQEAVTELKRCRNTQFDPIIVDTFVNMFEDRRMLH